MCGIVGFFLAQSAERVDRDLLRRMRDTLRHRGPDDAGEFVDDRVGLGHRRLSIIDLATGHQPLGNEDGSIQIVYNGETYNFQELQREAESRGHRFRTRCDTEAIVHLYEDLGEDVVHRLNGMFAFAIWDARRDRMVLARDRSGIKPLYYAWNSGRFAFASEIRPLLQLPWVSREIDPVCLDLYLTRGYVPAPRTIFRDVRKLPAAHTMVVDEGGITTRQYWTGDVQPDPLADEGDTQRRLLDELNRAVRSHLISDVPLGAFLSGGLDSSLVVALMRRHCSGRLKTFSVAVDAGDDLNEASHARAVAAHLGTDHHEIVLTAADMPGLLTETARFLDEPVSDPAAVPTWVLARLARQNVTVVLTGEGADETWAGYDVFRKGSLVANYRRLPPWLRETLTDPVLRRLPGSGAGARLVEASRNPKYLGRLSHVDSDLRRTLYTAAGAAAVLDEAQDDDQTAPALDGQDPFGSITRDLIASHLAERLLLKVDRMTMAHSLEARVPFLDYKLIEFALAVPSRLKLRGRQTKYLLRQALEGALPPAILARQKHGFDLPCSAWLRTTVAPLMSDLMAGSALSDCLDRHRLAALWRRHLAGDSDLGTEMWAILTLELWAHAVKNG